MSDFLLELQSEEIPARMQADARRDLEKLFRAAIADYGVEPGAITTWSTPRRLVLIAHDLPAETKPVHEEMKGPRVSAPEQALAGFLRKTGLQQDQLEDRNGVWFAVFDKPGRQMSEVLAQIIPELVRAFPWPKSMRWGEASIHSESLRWVRPLTGVVAMLGSDLVELAIGDIRSSRMTPGHRFHHPEKITIKDVSEYQEKLRTAHVIVDQNERERLIDEQARAAADKAGLQLIEDPGLVVENAGLTEWPVPLLGRFEPEFLKVPPEVIQLTARSNQKYFTCRDTDGKLSNAFICTANIVASDGGDAIVAGNAKVLAARLADARFFWDQDRRKTLAEHAEGLARITFHEKLGTLADKVERVAQLARWLVEEGIVAGATASDVKLAARLCKADLVTEMVGEFPELQGIMGGYYARAEGLPNDVADAIRDHYRPVGHGDEAPTASASVALSLADKLDTLVSFFAIDEKPTGSKDPFALRRAVLAIISIIFTNNLRFDLRSIPVPDNFQGAALHDDLLAFFAERLKVKEREAGVRHDLIDAVFALGNEGDLVRLLDRVHALQDFIKTKDGANLLAGYKRAANILKKEEYEPGVTNPAPDAAETALISAVDAAAPKAADAVKAEDFAGAMAALASLRAPIDAFFDDVTVNDADPVRRNARLGLLSKFRDAVHLVADFGKIEG